MAEMYENKWYIADDRGDVADRIDYCPYCGKKFEEDDKK